MSIEGHQIAVGDLTVDVVRKDIKNLHLAVYPPEGRVRVSAPLRLDDEAVRLAVITRMAWIHRQRAKFEAQVRQSAREYVSGESHYYWGTRFLLNVIYDEGPPRVVLRNKTWMDLTARVGSDRERRERVVQEWYRARLKEAIPLPIAKWEPVVGVEVADWRVKRMKTRWGTCTVDAGRVWLNLELVKKPVRCLEYVIVHEMMHLLERLHGERFVALMDEAMPLWRLHREELNQAPLAHATWEY